MLGKFYNGIELTGYKLEQEVDEEIKYLIFKEEFDKVLRDLKTRNIVGIDRIQGELRK